MPTGEYKPRRNPEIEALIREDIDNPQAWSVYSDWLLERDDPRGRVIALELAVDTTEDGVRRAQMTAEIQQLYAAHGKIWLGSYLNRLKAINRLRSYYDVTDYSHRPMLRFGFPHAIRLTHSLPEPGQAADQLSFIREMELYEFSTNIDPWFFKTMRQLKHLIICRCPDIGTTEWLRGFKELRQLSVVDTKIPPLQQTLATIAGLEKLVLINCGLTELPPYLGELRALQKLSLSYNKLATLPENLGRLENLKKLIARNNRLAELPGNLGHLLQLEYLDLAGNQLSVLPDTFHDNNRLQQLNLARNNFTAAPVLRQCKQLQILDLSSNRIDTLNDSFQHLQALQYINLDGNPLENLPEVLRQLPALANLRVSNTKITPKVLEAFKMPENCKVTI